MTDDIRDSLRRIERYLEALAERSVVCVHDWQPHPHPQFPDQWEVCAKCDDMRNAPTAQVESDPSTGR